MTGILESRVEMLSLLGVMKYILIPLLLLCSGVCANSIQMNEENWHHMNEGEWMVKFHAPWCPACKALIEPWNEFSKWSRDLDVNIGEVDVTENPGLSGRFLVTALPTIFHVKDGMFRQYSGGRDHKDFIDFIEDKKWEKIDPVPNWKRPTDIHMAALGQFFRLSMMLRNVHNSLQDDYGLPAWASYGIFAFATIITGCILGLMIVCCIDLVWPPKSLPPTSKPTSPPASSTANGKKIKTGSGASDGKDKQSDEEGENDDSDDVEDGDTGGEEDGEKEEEKLSVEGEGEGGVRQRVVQAAGGDKDAD